MMQKHKYIGYVLGSYGMSFGTLRLIFLWVVHDIVFHNVVYMQNCIAQWLELEWEATGTQIQGTQSMSYGQGMFTQRSSHSHSLHQLPVSDTQSFIPVLLNWWWMCIGNGGKHGWNEDGGQARPYIHTRLHSKLIIPTILDTQHSKH